MFRLRWTIEVAENELQAWVLAALESNMNIAESGVVGIERYAPPSSSVSKQYGGQPDQAAQANSATPTTASPPPEPLRSAQPTVQSKQPPASAVDDISMEMDQTWQQQWEQMQARRASMRARNEEANNRLSA